MGKRAIAAFVSTALCMGMLAGCGSKAEAPATTPAAGGAVEEKTAEKKTETKDSGKLVIYNCNTTEWTDPIIKEFEEQTGIKVDIVSGGSGEMFARITSEAQNPGGDIIWGGTGDAYLKILDYLQPYESTEKGNIMDDFLVDGDYYYNYVLDPYVIAYNSNIVSEADAPTSWADLLDEKWKGKISLADPSVSSSTFVALSIMQKQLNGDTEMLHSLVVNLDGKLQDGSSAQMKALDNGEYAISCCYEEAALKYVGNGSNMKVVYPSEGTQLGTGGIGIIKGGPNLENAQKFIDFALSKEVCDTLATYYRRTTRKDADTSTNELLVPLSEIEYIPYDFQWSMNNKAEFLENFRNFVTE